MANGTVKGGMIKQAQNEKAMVAKDGVKSIKQLVFQMKPQIDTAV